MSHQKLPPDNHPYSSSDDIPYALAVGIPLLGSALLFGYTLAPTVLWGDDAMFQRALAVAAPTNHPVWDALAHLFAHIPWGDLAFRANLASAVYAIGTVGCLFLTACTLGKGTRAALSAGAILTVSHAFWLHAVRAEVYTLHLLLFFGGLWAFLSWRRATTCWPWLVLGCAFWLAGTVNHLLLTMAFPGGLCLLLGATPPVERKRVLLLLAILLGLGAFSIATLAPAFFTKLMPTAIRYVSAAFGFSLQRLIMHSILLAYQFPLLGSLAIPGFRYLWHRDQVVALALGLMAFFTAVFAATFNVPDSYVFYLPVYSLIALWAGLGVAALTTRWPWPRLLLVGAILLTLQIGLYRITPVLLERLAPGLIPARDLPGRPANAFFLWPPKRGYTGARWFAETTFDLLPPNAVIVADWTLYTPLWYLQEVEGRRQDVLTLEMSDLGLQAICENSGLRPLFLANTEPRYYPIAKLTEHFRLEPVGPVFRLIPKGSHQ